MNVRYLKLTALQTNKQKNKQTGKQANKPTKKGTNKQTKKLFRDKNSFSLQTRQKCF